MASEAVAGVCAVLAKQAGGAFRGVAVGPVVGRLSSSESGGSGGGALRGGGATGSGVLASSTACGMNLAVGDSVLLDAACLLCGDGARLGGARCAGGSLGMALTGGVCSGAACGCGSDGCPNDGAEVEAELDETAVCKGRDRVGVADGDLLRRGDGNLDLPGVGEHILLCWSWGPSPVLRLGQGGCHTIKPWRTWSNSCP